ncbi:hypothetical protein LJC08_01385 [Methanimicrococcus sp. OttesenSCG-928-J09]|nr:hypothetical protein [Methanimicrococcus sp. OttesenSCG-928-J09]
MSSSSVSSRSSSLSVSFDSKSYFDYVSADLIDEIVSTVSTISNISGNPEDFISLYEDIDSFFQRMNLTDIIIFKKIGKSGSDSFSQFALNLFEKSKTDGNRIRYYKGIEIEAENENVLNSLIRKERANADFLAVRSADEKVIRAAAESSDVDLIIPVTYSAGSAGRSGPNGSSGLYTAGGQINHIVAKIARDKKTAFGFDMLPFLQTRGYRRSKIFADGMEMIPILRKYGVPVLLFSGALSFYDSRGPYELEAFGRMFGLTQEETMAAVSRIPSEIIKRRKMLKSGKLIANGVEILSSD